MTFGENLQRLREAASLSQSGLAKKAGLQLKSIQNWEIDRSQPRIDALMPLASALGVEVESLLVRTEKRPAKRK